MTTAEPPPGEAQIIPLARSARRGAAAGRTGVHRSGGEPLGAAKPGGGRPSDERPGTEQPGAGPSVSRARADGEPAGGGRPAGAASPPSPVPSIGPRTDGEPARPRARRTTSGRPTGRTGAAGGAARTGSTRSRTARPVAPAVAEGGDAQESTVAAHAAHDSADAAQPPAAQDAQDSGARAAPAKAAARRATAGDAATERTGAGNVPRARTTKAAGARPGRTGTGRGRSATAVSGGEPEHPEDRAERLLGRPTGQHRDGEHHDGEHHDGAALGAGVTVDAADVGAVPDTSAAPMAEPAGLERALAGMLAFLRRRITGDYEVDELGFDSDLTEHVVAPLLRPVYRNYFRVETRGLENVPDTGGALVVANHSGTLPIDALMTAVALLDHHPAHRYLRMLAADLVFSLPFLAPIARKTGNTLACQADAERLLGKGELVGVWPEGFKGVGKPFSERYKLQRFGRGGFVSAALRTGVPIIPCTIVGAEEIYPMLGNAKTVARLLGLPYFPLTPTFPWLGLLGMVPLPSKWLIEFGEPVPTAPFTPAAAEDPMLVFELTDRIRETIQHTLYGLLMQRRSVFF
ncbi:lysophospholipid acyltransferase family protein [Pseudofrankia sp. BMG5.37]|nr:lysophospholipid acyltransferase family protein [Pseudofrankia sp. BMG5.37]